MRVSQNRVEICQDRGLPYAAAAAAAALAMSLITELQELEV